MQDRRIPDWFFEALGRLYVTFPSAGEMPKHALAAWWQTLGEYPEWAVRKAFVQAPREAAQGQYLPSAESVRRLAEVYAKHPPVEHPPYRPQLTEGISAGPLGEQNPFMRLARSWEHESLELRLDPDAPSPLEIAKRRFAELNALLGGRLGSMNDPAKNEQKQD